MPAEGNGRLRFGEFEFDTPSGTLFRHGRPVRIEPQPLRVLSVLLENAPEIVSREHLRSRVWGDTTFVEFDQGLNYCIRRIRLALHDEASKPQYIETLPKQGYRFIACVTVAPGPVVIPAEIAADANQAYAAAADPNRIATATTQYPVSLSPARTPRNRFAFHVPWVAAISFGLLATFGVWAAWRTGHPVQPGAPLIFLPIDLGTGVSLFADNGPAMAISPTAPALYSPPVMPAGRFCCTGDASIGPPLSRSREPNRLSVRSFRRTESNWLFSPTADSGRSNWIRESSRSLRTL
jgi:DNA-binding winged helix-turn-helix (wHTH) protein